MLACLCLCSSELNLKKVNRSALTRKQGQYNRANLQKQRENMQNIINRVVGPVHSGVEGFRSSYGSRGRRHEPLTKSEQEASRDTDHRQGNFETKDGSLLHYHAWFPKYTQDGHLTSKEPATLDSVRTVSAVVIFVHGLHEHAGRFAPWARIMTKFNIGVYGIDHRGKFGKTSNDLTWNLLSSNEHYNSRSRAQCRNARLY